MIGVGVMWVVSTMPRRVQPIRHMLSRKRRRREMQERRDEFEQMLKKEKKKIKRK